MKWIYMNTVAACGQGFNSYISEDGKLGKTIWFDGHEEIFELA